MVQISSPRNPRVKYLRSLAARKVREQEGRFLAEGIRIVEEALDCGAPVETIVYAPDLLISERAQGLVERVDMGSRLALSEEAFRSLSEREDPQGIAAVVRIPDYSLADIPLPADLLVLVAYQLNDPGNVGTIIRTADAVGASGVVVVEPSADPYDPRSVRATMGSLFALPVVRLAQAAALDHWYAELRARGLSLLVAASSAHGDRRHFDVDFCRAVVLLVGSERHGLPAEVRQEADVVVRLPMAGRATSLNVAAATAALAYEVVRQRECRDGTDP